MALIKCPECGKEISDKAESCPNCGMRVKNNKLKMSIKIVLIIFLTIFVILAIIGIAVECQWGNDKISAEKTNVEEVSQEENVTITENEEFEENEEIVTLNKGDTVTTSTCQFTIKSFNMEKEVKPPKASGYYQYFEAAYGNTYIDLRLVVKNLQTSAVAQNNLIDSVVVVYDGEYEYEAFPITEEKNGESFNMYTDMYEIGALETMTYHYLAEVPSDIKMSDKSLDVIITVNGKKYIRNFR